MTDGHRASFADLAAGLLAQHEGSAMTFALQIAGAMVSDYVPVPVAPFPGSFPAAVDAMRAVRLGTDKDVGTLAIAKAFGDYRGRVTDAEATGARRVGLLLTALRTFEAVPADDLAAELAREVRTHLLARWGFTVPVPCPDANASRALCSSVAVRYDLLPAEWRAR